VMVERYLGQMLRLTSLEDRLYQLGAFEQEQAAKGPIPNVMDAKSFNDTRKDRLDVTLRAVS
jgi:hypothetical protein